MTDLERLCDITDVLRRHNKINGGLSASEAVYQIRKILNQPEGELKTAEWLSIGQRKRRDKMTDFEKLEKRIDKLEDMLLDILGAFSADAFEEAQLDKVLAKYGEIKKEVESRGE